MSAPTSKVAIAWTGANGETVIREFTVEVAIDQVAKRFARFVSPTAELLEQARDQAAKRLGDSARNVEAPMTPGLDFLKGPDRLKRAKALTYRMKR